MAYDTLSKADRRAKHLAAARYFEALGDDELAGVLATHYLEALRATPSGPEADALAAQARIALRAAADRATALHAWSVAYRHLVDALEITQDPGERAAVAVAVADLATNLSRPEAVDLALEAVDLATGLAMSPSGTGPLALQPRSMSTDPSARRRSRCSNRPFRPWTKTSLRRPGSSPSWPDCR